MVVDWILSAGAVVLKCAAVALMFVACIGISLVEMQRLSE